MSKGGYAIKSSAPCSYEFSPLIHDIQTLMQERPGWQVGFDFRETNRVAHELATMACAIHEEMIWMEDYPACVERATVFDKQCIDFLVE